MHREPAWRWPAWAWRRLTSMRTAVVLLVLTALAAVPGSLLPQRNVASDPFAVTAFYAEHPTLAPWLDRFSLFDVYASPWFAATYLVLLVSMTGCVVPRSLRLWHEVTRPPREAPRRLDREVHHGAWEVPHGEPPADALLRAEEHLRASRYRVTRSATTVRAEKGHVRELGNLVFHLSLLVLLVGVGVGRLYGYEGRVVLVEGTSFTNVVSSYDAITPSVLTDLDDLTPLELRLDSFSAEFATTGSRVGEPRGFDARVTLARPGRETESVSIRPNQPLDVDGTKFFLTGHGYAPVVTVRDGTGAVAWSGPVVFLPVDTSFTSEGVVKAPDAQPAGLGFTGTFWPTAVELTEGSASAFPGLVNPVLELAPWQGDLGLGDGTPQSVYDLDTSAMSRTVDAAGEPLVLELRPGDTRSLPGGTGSVTFDGVVRFANFQIASDPGKEVSLLAAVLLLGGLTCSLAVRRRLVWVRVTPRGGTAVVEIGARSLSRRGIRPDEIDRLGEAVAPDGWPRDADLPTDERVPT